MSDVQGPIREAQPSAGAGGSAQRHPFLTAWDERDVRAWRDALAPDVVVHSPLLRSPFVGREAVAELYGVLFELFGDVEVTDHLAAGDTSAFYWRGTVDGRTVEGADFVRSTPDGHISEIRVLMRPLVSLGTFTAAMGPALARREGRRRGSLVALVTAPIRTLFLAIDAVATRIGQRGSRP